MLLALLINGEADRNGNQADQRKWTSISALPGKELLGLDYYPDNMAANFFRNFLFPGSLMNRNT